MHLADGWYNHIYKGTKYDDSKDEEMVPSEFLKEIKKTCMAVDITDKMLMTTVTDGEYTFSINRGMDFLLYTYVYRTIAGYKVKEGKEDQVQIKWCHNLGHNLYSRSELVIDNDSKQTITNTWLDVHSNHF